MHPDMASQGQNPNVKLLFIRIPREDFIDNFKNDHDVMRQGTHFGPEPWKHVE